jgi:hypothetical protein
MYNDLYIWYVSTPESLFSSPHSIEEILVSVVVGAIALLTAISLTKGKGLL